MTEAEERAAIIAELALEYPIWWDNFKKVAAPHTADDMTIEHLRGVQGLWRRHAEKFGYPSFINRT